MNIFLGLIYFSVTHNMHFKLLNGLKCFQLVCYKSHWQGSKNWRYIPHVPTQYKVSVFAKSRFYLSFSFLLPTRRHELRLSFGCCHSFQVYFKWALNIPHWFCRKIRCSEDCLLSKNFLNTVRHFLICKKYEVRVGYTTMILLTTGNRESHCVLVWSSRVLYPMCTKSQISFSVWTHAA
jgi:hypothetical protein